MKNTKEKVLISFSAGVESTTLAFMFKDQGYDVTLATFEDGGYNNPESKYYDTTILPDKRPFFLELLWYQDYMCNNYGFKKEVIRFPYLQQITATDIAKPGNKEAQDAEALGLNFYVGFKSLMTMLLLSHGAAFSYKYAAFGHMPYNVHYSDELPESFNKVYELMVSLYGDRVEIPKIIHPFYEKDLDTKEKVIKKAIDLGVPLKYTYSCRADLDRLPDGRWPHCHSCENCIERDRAFKTLGIEDPA